MPRRLSEKKREAIAREIEKLMREWKEKGTMTTSRAVYRPKTEKEAIKQASAIAYGKHGVGRAGKRKKKK